MMKLFGRKKVLCYTLILQFAPHQKMEKPFFWNDKKHLRSKNVDFAVNGFCFPNHFAYFSFLHLMTCESLTGKQ